MQMLSKKRARYAVPEMSLRLEIDGEVSRYITGCLVGVKERLKEAQSKGGKERMVD